MFSKSSFKLLNLVSEEDFTMVNRIPRLMTVPSIISYLEDNNDPVEVVPQRRIIVTNHLPIKAHREEETKKWCFSWDNDALALQLKDGFPEGIQVLYVGCLKADIDVSEQKEVSRFLFKNFGCLPTFLSLEMQNLFYHGFCKHYLWPLFHYMLPMSTSLGARYNNEEWRAYVAANKVFANKIIEVINPDEDFVWIHDYHLMVLPTFLRRKMKRVKLGFFLHNLFPSSEIYRTLPVREEILRGLLNCDLVGFQTFDYARHFLSCCSRMLGLDYQSKRGYIGLEYYGRSVGIKILPVGIHMGQIESLLSLPETVEKVKQLKKQYEGKIVMVGVDDTDMFKGISLKFQALGQLLEGNPEWIGKVVLVQILNPARSQGKDIEDLETEINLIANQVNEKYGDQRYKPIVFVNGPVTELEKVAYYAIAECCVVNALRDGMNLVPYKYTVCRQGSPALDEALGVDGSSVLRKSVIIVSEFIGCSPSLSGAIRVNPWDIDSVSGAMDLAACMPDAEKHLRHEKHYKYISSHDVAYWARSFDQDLERTCTDHCHKRYFGLGLGLRFRVLALDPNLRRLYVSQVVPAYQKTISRLILLDYDGTMMPQGSEDKAPSSQVISVLNDLCSDPKNVVFIVSGRGREGLSNWFSPCEKLGISAEHGYFTRWTRDEPWESSTLAMDFDWKMIAEPVMQLYTERTDGSFIEYKESALVWHHQRADPDFGSLQAKELLDHLENVLANEPVVVKRGLHIIEVKPQGFSKGIAVENIISTMKKKGKSPDFVLCIGDDRSDEDMFSNPSLTAIAEVFACTIGEKPSKAKYYLNDPVEVINLLEGLTSASIELPKYADLGF